MRTPQKPRVNPSIISCSTEAPVMLHSFFLCMNCQRYTTRWQTKRTFRWNCYSLWLNVGKYENTCFMQIRVITKLPNSEHSYKGKVKTHKYINRQNQSTTRKLWKP
jgi:hypothetical protein